MRSSRQSFLSVSPALARTFPVVLLALAAAVVAWRELGSLAAPDWLPLAILAALLLATVAAAGAALRPPRTLLAGAGALVALAAWTAASSGWSASPAGARDEALLTAFYAIVLALPATVLAGAAQRRGARAAVVFVLAGLGALSALRLALARDPSALLFGGRLDFPVSYVNACSALFVLGFWPAVSLAARRSARVSLRSAAVAAAALFLALAVAAQSKGTVLGLAVSALLVFALSPRRVRLLAPALLAACCAGAAAVPLTGPYRSSGAAAAHHAGFAALAVLAAGALLGAGYAAADARYSLGPARRRLAGRALIALLAAALAAGTAAFVVRHPSPGAFASHTWSSFKHRSETSGTTHLTSLGSNRYDFWRVALDEARSHPGAGIGGRGFYSAYLRERRSTETPLRAHSLYLDVLAELGIPGLLALLAGIGAPVYLLARRLASLGGAGAFGAGTYFAAHAAVDWIWTVPVVGVTAFLLLGIGCAADRPSPLGTRAGRLAAAAAAAVAILAFAPPWLAHRYAVAASTAADPRADLRRARRFDPLSLEPYWTAWRLAATPAARIEALRGAHRREPESVAVLFQLGQAYARAGDTASARRTLRRALELDPREPAIRHALLTASR